MTGKAFARLCRFVLTGMIVVLASACMALRPAYPGSDPRYAATLPPEMPPADSARGPAVSDGSIYQGATGVSLFTDNTARRVGDVLGIVLAERTNAKKSAEASSTKDSKVDIPNPVVFGEEYNLNSAVTGNRSFDGKGDAAQSNLLEGTITVTVAAVLANGNLVVQGEKWVRINEGEEYVRLRGIVRPVDIRFDNTVLSTQVADAHIGYGGTGTLAQSSSPGLLSRFFNSPLWPF
jgi:flagellar L-ring protein precursor FlgH